MTAQVIDLRARRPAPLIRTRLPELRQAVVLPFTAPCPAWCTDDGAHDGHLAAIGAIAAQLPGRFDLITVAVGQQPGKAAVVDVRIQPSVGQPGALLDADTLDELIGALTEARRLIGDTTDPRPVRSARAGWASTSGRDHSPVGPGRAHPPMEAS